MSLFQLKAEVYLEAEDIDQAFWILAEHFTRLAAGEESNPFNPSSVIEIRQEMNVLRK